MIDAVQSGEAVIGPKAIPFESYEELCNGASHAARKNGILTKEIYDEVTNDPSTITAKLAGRMVPILVDMDHGLGLGYDQVRARQYVDDQANVSILAVPIGDLDTEAQIEILDVVSRAGARSIYFSDNGHDSEVLSRGLSERGVTFVDRPLLDSRAKPGFQEASLSFYELDVLNAAGENESKKNLADVLRHFNDETLSTVEDPDNAVLLRSGDSFAPEEFDELWDLYQNRFQYLGENHPMSMEDYKEDFLALFNDPTILVSLKYDQGRVTCFTYFTEDLSRLYWINQSFLARVGQDASPAEMVIFFPGIVADQHAGGLNANEVIARFAAEAVSINGSAKVLFENTNLSEQYVPKIVYRTLSNIDNVAVSQPKKIDETKYRLFEVFDRQG